MKVRIRTVKVEDTAAKDYYVPDDVAREGGDALSSWVSRCANLYRHERFKTAASLIEVDKEESYEVTERVKALADVLSPAVAAVVAPAAAGEEEEG